MAKTIVDETIFCGAITNRYYPDIDDMDGAEFFEEYRGYVKSWMHERGSDKSNIFDTDSRACQRKIDWYITRELYFEQDGRRIVVSPEARVETKKIANSGRSPKKPENIIKGLFGSGDPCTQADRKKHQEQAAKAVKDVKDLLVELDAEGFAIYSLDDIMAEYSNYLKRQAAKKDVFENGPYKDENGVWHIVP